MKTLDEAVEIIKADVFYSVGEREILTADTIDEAVQEFLDELYWVDENPEIPETVEVQCYVRSTIDDRCFVNILESLAENLDEEYGDPDGEIIYTPSEEVLATFEKFKEAVKADFKPWKYMPHGEAITVKTAEYLERMR